MSFLTDSRPYFVQPGKAYLLLLGYQAHGDYYQLANSWDLSDGTVRANSGIDHQRELEGGSELLGLTQEQLIHLLKGRFSR